MMIMPTELFVFFFFKQKTAYEMRISDLSSDVCSSDLPGTPCMAETMRKDAHTAGQSMAQAMDMPHGAADSAHRPPAPSLSQPITGAGLIAPAERARQRDRQTL